MLFPDIDFLCDDTTPTVEQSAEQIDWFNIGWRVDVSDVVSFPLRAIWPFSLANNRLPKKFIAASPRLRQTASAYNRPCIQRSQWTWTRVTERRITAIGYRIGFFIRVTAVFFKRPPCIYIYYLYILNNSTRLRIDARSLKICIYFWCRSCFSGSANRENNIRY